MLLVMINVDCRTISNVKKGATTVATAQAKIDNYKPTGDIEVLLEALKKHADKDKFYTFASEQDKLKSLLNELDEHQRRVTRKKEEVEEAKQRVSQVQCKVAHIINTLGSLGCPSEVIESQWKNYDHKFVMPWPNGHDIAAWIQQK